MHSFGSNISSFQPNRPSGPQRNSIATGSKRTVNGSHPGADFEPQPQLPHVENRRPGRGFVVTVNGGWRSEFAAEGFGEEGGGESGQFGFRLSLQAAQLVAQGVELGEPALRFDRR